MKKLLIVTLMTLSGIASAAEANKEATKQVATSASAKKETVRDAVREFNETHHAGHFHKATKEAKSAPVKVDEKVENKSK